MNRISAALLALALAAPLAACTENETEDFRDVSTFVDGMAVDSDMGAFRVVLSSDDGDLAVGRNDLIVRVGFHDPSDPSAEGRGVPGADLFLDAWMPGADLSMQSDVEISYLGDGAYALDNVVLTEAGVWNVDLDIRVGEGMYETVSLAFEVAEPKTETEHHGHD
ncbi:MAG: FixH family protein [Myxococcales bacterium]|nr:FixH family protein [Myxococcales bacterium]